MQGTILTHPQLPVILSRIDFELAERARAGKCPFCGGELHSARYPRKPRSPWSLGRGFAWRLSFCCAAEGCRRRTTPPSVVFFGRRVWLGVVVVLVTALAQGVTGRRLRELRAWLGVDRRTLVRWREWWRETFPATAFWRARRAPHLPPVDETRLPGSLVSRYATHTLRGVVLLLRFLAPLAAPASAFFGGGRTRRGCSS